LFLFDQSGKDLIGCFKVEYFAWSVVESFGDDVEIVLAVAGQVGSFGQILADEAIGVFVRSSLPRAVGICNYGDTCLFTLFIWVDLTLAMTPYLPKSISDLCRNAVQLFNAKGAKIFKRPRWFALLRSGFSPTLRHVVAKDILPAQADLLKIFASFAWNIIRPDLLPCGD
jgi:hypothetical protein